MTDSIQPSIASRNVFVTYAWDNENPAHQGYVMGFVNLLRSRGVNAEMDLLMSERETAIHFPKMMVQGISYDKVIIFMSKMYREKANLFAGGVGTEYELIIADLRGNPRKYILVSTDGYEEDVVPRMFQGREVVSLSSPILTHELDKVLHKIWDTNSRSFVDVASFQERPTSQPPSILQVAEATHQTPVIINELNAQDVGASSTYNKFSDVNYVLEIDIQNQSSKTLNDIVLEITIPKEFSSLRRDGVSSIRQDKHNFYLSYTFSKTYPEQTQVASMIAVTIDYEHAKVLYDKVIKAKVYGEGVAVEKDFPIKDMMTFSGNGRRRYLTPDDFGRMEF